MRCECLGLSCLRYWVWAEIQTTASLFVKIKLSVRPQFSETTWDTAKQEIEKESQVDSEQDRVIGFLDAALREHGPRCAAYIRSVLHNRATAAEA